MKRKYFYSSLVCVLLLSSFSLSGCGGGGSGGGGDGGSDPVATTMNRTAAESITKSLSRAATSSMQSSAFKQPSLSDSLLLPEVLEQNPLAKALYSVSCTQTSCVINQPITARLSCTAGGRMDVTGNISGTINNTGTGLIQIQATETISDWSCSPPYIVNGDPYISLTGTFSFMNGAPSTQQHIGINGGFKWGTSSVQSCQLHLDTNFDRNGGGRTTGSVCGYTVDISF